MIGLVNAIGASQALRVQSTDRTSTVRADAPEERAPLLNSEMAANQVLRTAVEGIVFRESARERETPNSEQSDRAAQMDLEQKTNPQLGNYLDIVA